MKIRLWDVYAIASGFTAGYLEGKGHELGFWLDYSLKCNPAIMHFITPMLYSEILYPMKQNHKRKELDYFYNDKLSVPTMKSESKTYSQMDEDEKNDMEMLLKRSKEFVASPKPRYLLTSFACAGYSGLETLVGYGAGRIAGQFF